MLVIIAWLCEEEEKKHTSVDFASSACAFFDIFLTYRPYRIALNATGGTIDIMIPHNFGLI